MTVCCDWTGQVPYVFASDLMSAWLLMIWMTLLDYDIDSICSVNVYGLCQFLAYVAKALL